MSDDPSQPHEIHVTSIKMMYVPDIFHWNLRSSDGRTLCSSHEHHALEDQLIDDLFEVFGYRLLDESYIKIVDERLRRKIFVKWLSKNDPASVAPKSLPDKLYFTPFIKDGETKCCFFVKSNDDSLLVSAPFCYDSEEAAVANSVVVFANELSLGSMIVPDPVMDTRVKIALARNQNYAPGL